MSYRGDLHALKARSETLERDIAELRERADELARKERELSDVKAALKAMGNKRALPLLDVRVASPCKANWNEMIGDDRTRFCGQCAKNVYNLSAMSREEADALLREKAFDLCVRFYQRADGTVMTTDCPVGARKKRVRRLAAAAVGSGMMAAGAAVGLGATHMGAPCRATAIQGEMVPQGLGVTAEETPMVMGSVMPDDPAPPTPPAAYLGRPAPKRAAK